jgi:hypothetical protein
MNAVWKFNRAAIRRILRSMRQLPRKTRVIPKQAGINQLRLLQRPSQS